jgi:hypothetical protein
MSGWRALALLAVCGLTGCGISSNLKSDGRAVRIAPNESVLLLGLDPNMRVHLLRGKSQYGFWNRPNIDVPEVNLFPEQGFVTVKVPATAADELLGVSLVFPGGRAYGPCDGDKTPVFALKGGAVTYVGNLSYSTSGGSLSFSDKVDESAARAFLGENHPALAAQMVTQPLKLMAVHSNLCSQGTAYIPIYIPSR